MVRIAHARVHAMPTVTCLALAVCSCDWRFSRKRKTSTMLRTPEYVRCKRRLLHAKPASTSRRNRHYICTCDCGSYSEGISKSSQDFLEPLFLLNPIIMLSARNGASSKSVLDIRNYLNMMTDDTPYWVALTAFGHRGLGLI